MWWWDLDQTRPTQDIAGASRRIQTAHLKTQVTAESEVSVRQWRTDAAEDWVASKKIDL